MATAMAPFAPYSPADPEHTPLVKSVSRLYTLEREPKGGAYAPQRAFYGIYVEGADQLWQF